jgi:AbrB family looped-hinge helix DNA binding protein
LYFWSEEHVMAAHRLTSKGQVTIPKAHRDAIGLRPGDAVSFEVDDEGHRLVLMRTEYQDPKDHPLINRLRGARFSLGGLSTDEYMRLVRGED